MKTADMFFGVYTLVLVWLHLVARHGSDYCSLLWSSQEMRPSFRISGWEGNIPIQNLNLGYSRSFQIGNE